MRGEILIGLDLGTTNAKAAAYTPGGDIIASASVGYPTRHPKPGQAEQRPADWIDSLSRAMRQLTDALGARRAGVATIGLSAHGPGALLVDERGDLLTDTCPTWQDERAIPYGRRLLEAVGSDWIGPGMPLSGFPARLCQLLEDQPNTARVARYALGIKDYLVNWLTGEYATEPSSGPGGDSWWTPVFDAFGWPAEKLPPVLPPTAAVGPVRAALADEWDLPPVPVVMGLNDGASATLACGAVSSGDIAITLATNGVVRVVLDHPLPADQRIEYSVFCVPYVAGRWLAGGFAKSGASALDWFVRLAGGDGEAAIEAALTDAAGSPTGSRDVVFMPYLLGRGTPQLDEQARGSFLNLAMSHGRGDLARSVLEGVAYAVKDIYACLTVGERRGGDEPRAIHLSGGGAKSPLWRQIIADVIGKPVRYYAAEATLGAAIMAAVGVGIHANPFAAVDAMTRSLDTAEPQPDQVECYMALYNYFRSLRDQLISLPRAPQVAERVAGGV